MKCCFVERLFYVKKDAVLNRTTSVASKPPIHILTYVIPLTEGHRHSLLIFSLQLRSDLPNISTCTRLTPPPARSYVQIKVLSPSSFLSYGKILTLFKMFDNSFLFYRKTEYIGTQPRIIRRLSLSIYDSIALSPMD